MEIGGRGALKSFQRPLAVDSGTHDVESGHPAHGHTDSAARASSSSTWHGAAASSSSKGPQTPDRASRPDLLGARGRRRAGDPGQVQGRDRDSAADGYRRRLQGPAASWPRGATPIRGGADIARDRLCRSLKADGEVRALCVCDTFDLEAFGRSLGPESSQARTFLPELGPNGVVVTQMGAALSKDVLPVKLFLGGKDLFVFRFGSLVFWNFSEKELEMVKGAMRKFMIRELHPNDVDQESMDFIIQRRAHEDDDDDALPEEDEENSDDPSSSAPKAVYQDQINLFTSKTFERLAHSYALAQSVRLGVYEVSVDRNISITRPIPESMAATGEVKMDGPELAKRMGGLLMLRCEVNLHTDILDTPEIFWDEEQFEPYYLRCRQYFEVDKRVEILNQRLAVLKDLYDLLQNTINVNHGTRLEMIVIYLILVEVLLELLELMYDFWRS